MSHMQAMVNATDDSCTVACCRPEGNAPACAGIPVGISVDICYKDMVERVDVLQRPDG